MKIAATIVLLVAALCVAERIHSNVSIGDTIKSDFLNLDTPAPVAEPTTFEDAEAAVIEDWIDTIRRRRTRRQSRFT